MPLVLSKPKLPNEEVQESLYELLEFLDLLHLRSPRIQSTDQVDPFISRYSIPCDFSDEKIQTCDVRILEWKGLIPAAWITTLLNELMYVFWRFPTVSISTVPQP